jgi:hypothetical protein
MQSLYLLSSSPLTRFTSLHRPSARTSGPPNQAARPTQPLATVLCLAMNLSTFLESPLTHTGDHLYVATLQPRVFRRLIPFAQDISARSPIIPPEGRPRQSLDSSYHRQPPRSSLALNRPLPTADEGFEDVGLEDPKPKKRGFLSRFADSNDEGPDAKPTSSHFHFGSGRKRGQSGQGAELKPMTEKSNDE